MSFSMKEGLLSSVIIEKCNASPSSLSAAQVAIRKNYNTVPCLHLILVTSISTRPEGGVKDKFIIFVILSVCNKCVQITLICTQLLVRSRLYGDVS